MPLFVWVLLLSFLSSLEYDTVTTYPFGPMIFEGVLGCSTLNQAQFNSFLKADLHSGSALQQCVIQRQGRCDSGA